MPRDLNSKLRAEAVAKLRAVFCLPATCQAAVKHQTKEHRSKAFNAKRTGGLYRAKRRKGRPSDAHGYALMFVPGINPHGFRFSGSLETHRFVELDGFAVCGEHLLMKAAVDPLHNLHDFATNTFSLMVRMHQ